MVWYFANLYTKRENERTEMFLCRIIKVNNLQTCQCIDLIEFNYGRQKRGPTRFADPCLHIVSPALRNLHENWN